jgi:hypothetical protein
VLVPGAIPRDGPASECQHRISREREVIGCIFVKGWRVLVEWVVVRKRMIPADFRADQQARNRAGTVGL